uniref:G-patch domain-containing protein n=1 Tax=Fagus sylvatica TaxID=28930 RepID=A0A2N9EJT0_FAGSY
MISKRQEEICPALSPSKVAQTLPTPRRPAFHVPRPSRTEPRQFQPLPIPVSQLYTLAGEVGHTVGNCRVLRHRIQDLLDQGVLKFRIEGIINAIGAEKSDEVDITSSKIPWEPFPTPRAQKELAEAGIYKYYSEAQGRNPQSFKEVKKEVTSLIMGEQTSKQEWIELKRTSRNFVRRRKKNWGNSHQPHHQETSKPDPVVIQYATKEKIMLQTASVSTIQSSEKVPSVVIQVPQPFPYQDSKRIPWNYGMKVISTREGKPKTEEEAVGNLTSGLGGITRSGRCYTPEELEKRRKEIGKTVEDPTKTKAAEEEAADFLRIIKSSEYSVVKQLSKMPSHISVLSLLLASESHRKALLKVLNEAYVPEDITGPSFENMVTSILVTNQLTFSDDELPPEGRGPHQSLVHFDIDPTRVRATSMVVRAFDGTRREVIGEIDLPIEIGPQVYDINFQVLRIDSPYNLLLGRPWLHTAGAVPSSLHQKMKFIIGNQLVTILAEEPISIYNDGAVPYIDRGASEEASFHSFEFVTVIHKVAAVEPKLSKAGMMVAKEFIKAGFQPGQGLGCANQGRTAIVALKGNRDRYGLGYTPTRKDRQFAYEVRRWRAVARLRGEKWPEEKMIIPHIRTTFPASAMFQVDGGDEDELALLFAEDLSINAIEEDSTAPLIYPGQCERTPGKDVDFPNLLPHLMAPRGLETLEFEIFCENEDPESHLRRYREKLTLYTDDELLMISMFHESLPECAVTWFYQLKNIACWKDLAEAFLDRYSYKVKPPVKSLGNSTTTTTEEARAGPMIGGMSIDAITTKGNPISDLPLPAEGDIGRRDITTAYPK